MRRKGGSVAAGSGLGQAKSANAFARKHRRDVAGDLFGSTVPGDAVQQIVVDPQAEGKGETRTGQFFKHLGRGRMAGPVAAQRLGHQNAGEACSRSLPKGLDRDGSIEFPVCRVGRNVFGSKRPGDLD